MAVLRHQHVMIVMVVDLVQGVILIMNGGLSASRDPVRGIDVLCHVVVVSGILLQRVIRNGGVIGRKRRRR